MITDRVRHAGYARQSARTQRFTLGRPHTFRVARAGDRLLYVRSSHGEDPRNRLWELDLTDGSERLLVDPGDLARSDDRDLPPAERARRERLRESGGGIVAFAGDRELATVTFALAGDLFVLDAAAASARHVPTHAPVFDPRIDPTGRWVAYVCGDDLRVIELASGADRLLAGDDEPWIGWGAAEFVAAEEMGRTRGYWWSPDGTRLAVTRVDTSPVTRWWISSPVDPAAEPVQVAYPAAGTDNADVTLWVVDLDGEATRVHWDRDRFEYLARVSWGRDEPLTLLVQTRDQRRTEVLVADPDTGETETRLIEQDEHWVELVDGLPAWLPDGRLVTTVQSEDTRRLAFDGEPVTPAGVHVHHVVDVGDAGVLAVASTDDPTQRHVLRLGPDGDLEWLTAGVGVHGAAGTASVPVLTSSSTEDVRTRYEVRPAGRGPVAVTSHQAEPVLTANVRFLELGARRLPAALLLPHDEPEGRLPVLLDPYGGPHGARVLRAGTAHLTSQWFAEQGFAVLVIDGRGMPGRGHGWERAVHRDFAGPVLEDQVDGLEAAAELEPRLDLGRVAMRGWSFGGYLAAMAVLRRPDRFHAAIAGAPVTDQRLYDTHYTERYLGDPNEVPEVYEHNSLIADAPRLERPLLLIHGLADDNVVAAHTLRLSRALLEAGRPHQVLPLSNVTHMTPPAEVAENLLRLQLSFLRNALGARGSWTRS